MEKWDKREESNNRQEVWNSMFNWKLIPILAGLFFIISLIIVGLFPPAHGGEDDTVKVFEDGVTYVIYEDERWGTIYRDYSIMHEGVEYECNADTHVRASYINPQCIEIIMRSMP